MRQQFAQSPPAGETVRAGIHAIAKESTVRGIFSGCILDDLTLFPSERGETIKVQKSKQSTYVFHAHYGRLALRQAMI